MNRRRSPHLRTRSKHGPRTADAVLSFDPVEALVARSRRLLRRGELRCAVVALRRACALDDHRARPFTLLGALLLKIGRGPEAEAAFRHARWLRTRAGEPGRAAATQRLLDRAHKAA